MGDTADTPDTADRPHRFRCMRGGVTQPWHGRSASVVAGTTRAPDASTAPVSASTLALGRWPRGSNLNHATVGAP